MQFLLSLSDRQAAEAVRCRIDFKYAMTMELDDPGFHHSVLADFRDRLTEGDRADRLLALALARLREARGCSVPTHPSASGLALGSTTSRLQLADTSFQLLELRLVSELVRNRLDRCEPLVAHKVGRGLQESRGWGPEHQSPR
ncbi:transposase [Streptomyces niveus]|uniref:transposase n=1 Tax=Streptomyces niveus TaxID=193462 RepID=UPI00344979DC